LLIVLLIVHLLHGSHLLDLVEVHDEAGVHVVQVFDALTAENARVLTAIEMSNSLVMIVAQIRLQIFNILLVVNV